MHGSAEFVHHGEKEKPKECLLKKPSDASERISYLQTARRAAQTAGSFIRDSSATVTKIDIEMKGVNDFVTRVDRKSEEIITSILAQAFPDYGILGEEGGGKNLLSPFQWVIDPLDGTTNFIQGIPWFSISIALTLRNRTIFGLVYDPCRKEIFHAWENGGAFLNSKPIHVSPQQTLEGAFGATGFPFKAPHMRKPYSFMFSELLGMVNDMRRCGSAALDLAYTACGRYDFFWEAHLLPWDFMAGELIVREAGGETGNFFGQLLTAQERTVIAANRILFQQLREKTTHFFSPPARP
jgi:myo-inositol-1(or 4)-monophosphatase